MYQHIESFCKKDCQACNLNREDAMDHGRWHGMEEADKDWMMIRMVGG